MTTSFYKSVDEPKGMQPTGESDVAASSGGDPGRPDREQKTRNPEPRRHGRLVEHRAEGTVRASTLPTEDTVGGVAASGFVAGVVGSLPAFAPTVVAACAGCLGVAPAATAGAATGAGVSIYGIAGGLMVLAVLIAAQLRRARQRYAVGVPSRSRGIRGVITVTAAAALSFAVMQWVIAPALAPAASDAPAIEQLP